MISLILTQPSPDDLARLAAQLRWQDKVEITRSSGTDALSVLQDSVALSAESIMACTRAGEPVLACGVVPTPQFPKVGLAWMLGTKLVEEHPLTILRKAAPLLDRWCESYPHGLQNYVDAENTLARRWLRLLGFVELQQVLLNTFPFIHVYRHV